MTTLALAEHVSRALADLSDHIETERTHQRVVFLVTVGKQVFRVTCEESAPDKSEPSV
jgi:hypothetical protein